jgi:hypothetical protein
MDFRETILEEEYSNMVFVESTRTQGGKNHYVGLDAETIRLSLGRQYTDHRVVKRSVIEALYSDQSIERATTDIALGKKWCSLINDLPKR